MSASSESAEADLTEFLAAEHEWDASLRAFVDAQKRMARAKERYVTAANKLRARLVNTCPDVGTTADDKE